MFSCKQCKIFKNKMNRVVVFWKNDYSRNIYSEVPWSRGGEFPEAATWGCSYEKVFWRYAANLQENTQSVISIKLQSNFIEITLGHGCSPVNLLHMFRIPFPRNTFGWLLLYRPFHGTSFFLYTLKTSENQGISEVFRGIKRERWYEMG